MFLMPAAQASGGRVTVHGAVLNPTCSPELPAQASTGAVQGAGLQACPDARRPAGASSARLYSVKVVPMSGDLLKSDAYTYFSGFTQNRGAMKLVVQRFD